MLAPNAAKPISGDIQLRLRLFVSMARNSLYAVKQSLSRWLMAVWGTLGCSTSALAARRGVAVGPGQPGGRAISRAAAPPVPFSLGIFRPAPERRQLSHNG